MHGPVVVGTSDITLQRAVNAEPIGIGGAAHQHLAGSKIALPEIFPAGKFRGGEGGSGRAGGLEVDPAAELLDDSHAVGDTQTGITRLEAVAGICLGRLEEIRVVECCQDTLAPI